MTFAEAAAFILTGGPHKGKPIGIVAVREHGLLDLDFRRDLARIPEAEWLALETYLSHPQIAEDLDRLQAERGA